MKLPSVLIFTPIYDKKDYALPAFLEKAKAINYPNKKHILIDNSPTMDYYHRLKAELEPQGFYVYHVDRGNNTREALTRSQVFARRMALDEGFDYLMSIESDIMVPPVILQWLIARMKPVVTVMYFIGDQKNGQKVPCVAVPEFHEDVGVWGSRLLKVDELGQFVNNGLVQVHTGGMGGCLIRRDVLEKITFYYDPRYKGHSDIYFFNDCFKNRIPVFVDTDIWCDHDNKPWNDVEDR